MANIHRVRITKTAVDRMQPGDTLRDTELKGFGVRRQQGDPSYFLQKKIDGRLRWITIGPHGSPWTPETARRKASALLMAYAHGQDPEAMARERRARQTVSEVAEEFLADHGPRLKPRTLAEYQRLFAKFIVPKFGRRLLTDLTRGDVASFHAGMSKTPSQANFALTAFSALYTWAESQELLAPNSNPCRGVARYQHKMMDRYLTGEELARVGQALNQLESSAASDRFALAAIRLLILTGARRSEILTLKWDHVDLPRRRLQLPDSKTGQKTIHLNDAAIAVLTGLPRLVGNPYVVPGRLAGTHLANVQNAWDQVRRIADIGNCRVHDLRHSFASLAVDAGASLPMIGKLLGHTQPRTTARYAHLTDTTLQRLNEDIGGRISEAMSPSRPKSSGG